MANRENDECNIRLFLEKTDGQIETITKTSKGIISIKALRVK